MNSLSKQYSSQLVSGLMQQQCYDHPVDKFELIETHISWIILTGQYAYKLKKPLDLGFLDFSSLEKRHFYCQQEILLNQRLAPDIYLEVVNINGSEQNPRVSGEGSVIEYAVKMLQFPQSSQLDRMLTQGQITDCMLDAFAHLLADFHQHIPVASRDAEYGEPEGLLNPVKENFNQLFELLTEKLHLERIRKLENWSINMAASLEKTFVQRKAHGFIRECHGDCHLRNMAWVNGKPLLFDCIEFDENLRWIDVINEVAFLIMDLQKAQSHRFASRFLNRYLESTGDYFAMKILPFYLCYRALVRAKIEAIQAANTKQNSAQQIAAKKAVAEYLQLAQNFTQAKQPQLIITHGFSACGKTTVSQELLERLPAIRLRSDVERKRLFGLRAKQSGHSEIDQNIYDPQASNKTYQRLLDIAEYILDSGFSVIIDAAFFRSEQRKLFHDLAKTKQIAHLILDIIASEDTLRWRIEQREKGASDADANVLQHQLETAQALKPEESAYTIRVDTDIPLDIEALLKLIKEYSMKTILYESN